MNQETKGTRVRFSTAQIAPKAVPPFVYTPSVIEFDRVQYTALLPAGPVSSQPHAVLESFWPDARIIVLETGTDSFLYTDLHLHQPIYGTHEAHAPAGPSLWERAVAFIMGSRARSLRDSRPGTLPAGPTRSAQ